MSESDRKRREASYRLLSDELERLQAARERGGGPSPGMLDDRIAEKERQVAEAGRGLQGEML